MDNSLNQLFSAPEALSFAEAEALHRKFPYFIYPGIATLNSHCSAEQRQKLKRRAAAHIGDIDALMNLFGPDGDVFEDFYPDMHTPQPSTDDTIDAFLNKFGSPAGLQSDPLNFAPAVDYAAILEAEEKGESQMPPAAAPSPVNDVPVSQTVEAPSNRSAEPPTLSESLAKIMIRQGNFEKALEIITDLSLNNPEKSIYFADQIRFLRKLIINKRHS